eukprot:CAMPEP_0172508792 /NCGR_PEP_ID=MMETSP1066-20121228/214892_1 /TAXON_ID=671091 /ORGANISM="Coscinodiscus wailesii, Strain CCMP2513" /LENGTH=1056 /DNA_ID=CAMNT_0013286955 /DNA_START=592 /DNA_END=3762 /DNA_ORIENTATION=+
MNKLEESRRSRHCVEVREHTSITVNSPLDGSFDCDFNRVFDDKASQKVVYEYAASKIPSQLLAGHNCTVIAYGQTGSGKTHTMIGAGGDSPAPTAAAKAAAVAAFGSASRKSQKNYFTSAAMGMAKAANETEEERMKRLKRGKKGSEEEDPNYETSGMIPRVIRDLFREIEDSDPNVEFTVRCSCIEIYLERILDLLDPSARNLSVMEVPMAEFDEDVRDRLPFYLFSDGGSGVYIEGMTEACCFDEADVMALFVRGNATRTVSSTRMNTDSSRSHAIFIVTVEQRNNITGRTRLSRLHMVDLAGSEISGVCKKNRRATAASTSIQQEAMMINKSLASLGSVVRALTENRVKNKNRTSHTENQLSRLSITGNGVPYKSSKLTRVLKEALGGNCLTTFILTASPSSYNISETINTIRFGQRARLVINHAKINQDLSVPEYKAKVAELETNTENLENFALAMCQACWKLKRAGKGQLSDEAFTGPIWDTIQDQLGKDPRDHDLDDESDNHRRARNRRASKSAALNGLVERIRSHEKLETLETTSDEKLKDSILLEMEVKQSNKEIEKLKHLLQKAQGARDHSESLLAEVQSGLAVLRTQNETLTKEKKKITLDLINAKNEVELLTSQKLDLETRFRTSQFRENEATIFLRQFRMFYRRLLRNKAAHGTGDVGDIISKVPDVPDLQDLVDIDIVLYECGLIEEEELHDDQAYIESFRPSQEAMTRSTKAALSESKLHPWETTSTNGDTSSRTLSTTTTTTLQLTSTPSTNESANHTWDIVPSTHPPPPPPPPHPHIQPPNRALPPSTLIEAQTSLSLSDLQQHQIQQMQSEKEKELTADLRRMTERCIELQIALNQEKSNVDILTNRSGSLRQKRLAQEAISLRKELDRKTHDVQLIIWKMNELNMINKAYNEKMKNRDHHVNYLEECLVDLQNVNKGLLADKLESEGKLREGLENLQALVDAMTVPLWQFGEGKGAGGGRKLANRVVLPIHGQMNTIKKGKKDEDDKDKDEEPEDDEEEEEDDIDHVDDDHIESLSLPSEPESEIGDIDDDELDKDLY